MPVNLSALLQGAAIPKVAAPLVAPSVPKIAPTAPPMSPLSQALANILAGSGAAQPNVSAPITPSVGGFQFPNFTLGSTDTSTGTTGPALDPKVQKLSNIYAADAAKSAALGMAPPSHRPSLIHRVFDLLSRPEYAVSNALLQGDKAVSQGKSWLDQFGAMGSGALSGLEGKSKTMYGDVIQQLRDAANARGQSGFENTLLGHSPVTYTPGQSGPMQSILGKGLTIGANIVGDPLNLVSGVGVPEKLTNVAKTLGKAGEVSDATKAADALGAVHGISAPGELTSLVRPATAIPSVTQATQTESRVQQILDQLQPHMNQEHLALNTKLAEQAGLGGPVLRTGQTTTTKLAKTVQNIDRGIRPADLIGTGKRAETNRLAMEIRGQSTADAAKAYKDMQSSVLEDMTRATRPATIRRAGVKIAGKQLTLTPEAISSRLRSLGNESGINEATRAFQKAFISTGRMSPELQAVSGASRGMSHGPWASLIHTMGDRFHGMNEGAIGNSLRHVVNNTPELGSSPEIEAAIHAHVGDIVDKLQNSNEHGLNITDFNHHLSGKDKLTLNPESANIIQNGTRDQAIKELEMTMSRGVEANKSHPLDYLARLGNGGIKADAAKAIRSQLVKFGIKDEGPVAEALKNTHGYKELKQTPGFIYHPDIHNDASRMFDLLTNHGQSEEFTNQLGKIVTLWKKLATIYNLPGYPTRNFIANSYMAWLVGGQHGLGAFKSSIMAAKQMAHRLDKVDRGSIDPVRAVLKKEMDKEIGGTGPVLYHTKGGFPVSPDLNDAAYRGNGLESTFTGTTYTSHPATATGVRAAAHKVNASVLAANKAVEDFGRHGVFIHHMRMSSAKNQAEFEKEAALAANKVRKALFDYGDSTAFEKKTMVKLFPFYKWNRKAIPALFHGLLDHPGKVLNFQMALEQGLQLASGHPAPPNDPWGLNQVEPLSRIPNYIAQRMSTPFGKMGKTGAQQYLDPAIPFNDELRLLGDPSSIISQISPLLRVPIEDTMGKQFFHDLPIKNRLQYSTVGQVNILRSLLKASGNSGAPVGASGSTTGSTATSKSPLDAILQTFNPLNSIVGPQQNTPKSQASTLLANNTALAKKIKALHDAAVKNAGG